MNTKMLLPVIAGAIGLAGLGGIHAFAASTSQAPRPIVQKIAQKFGLKEADVQAVFDQDKTGHMAQMKTNLSTKLDQQVKDGKLTATQKQAILDKMDQLHQQHEVDRTKLENITPAERKAAMQKHRQEMQDWAKQNNIDLKDLPFRPKGFGPRGHRGLPMMDGGPHFESN